MIYAAPRPGVKQTDQEGGPDLDSRTGRREGRAGGGKDGKEKGRRVRKERRMAKEEGRRGRKEDI